MSIGKLYILHNNIKGEWIQNIIMLLSNLYCDFIERSEIYENGIKINMAYEGDIISNNMAIFFVNCYIMKEEEIYLDDGMITYFSPINIVLNEINVADNCLNEINTILNHPHFKGCTSINDINKKISSVPNLNDRYKSIL
tara:strand:- start:20 stop:439 length:420 start_codon:yes stop_codon:yes gene_type:complete